MTATQKTIEHSGSSIAYETFGAMAPGGEALVFLPGWCCTADSWREAALALETRWPSIAVDYPGFGGSRAGSHSAWTIESLARDVKAVMEAEEIAEAIVVGHSMGGAVALEVARIAKGVVTGVVGVDSFIYSNIYNAVEDPVADGLLAALRDDFPGAVGGMMQPFIVAGPGQRAALRQLETMMAADPALAIPVMASFLRWDFRTSLAHAAVPVAVVAARALDPGGAGDDWRVQVPVFWVDKVGHFLMVEDVASFTDQLELAISAIKASNP